MKVATIVGARPQFVKAAPLSQALALAGHEELLIHTGQHYDDLMSDVFFRDLPIPGPRINLGVGSGHGAWQVAETLRRAADALHDLAPDVVVVFGDTNATLGGALAARKMQLPLAHVEAGLRSWNRDMPEEDNRVLTDHLADRLFCPTPTAVANLEREGLGGRATLVGDVMLDAVRQFLPVARARSSVLDRLGLQPGAFYLATIHRNYNTDDSLALRALLRALNRLGRRVVFPVHPRTHARLVDCGLEPESVTMIDPVSYLDMLRLQESAAIVLTDSGGMQKESLFLGTPCVTLRPETEWIETVESGWNVLVGADPDRIVDAVRELTARPPDRRPRPLELFGNGEAARRIARDLSDLATWPGRPASDRGANALVADASLRDAPAVRAVQSSTSWGSGLR
jgi:UDP-N-acetylglucosamine 2-epimerase